MDLTSIIRTIPDYPKPGIMFRDITSLLKHPAGFKHAIDALVNRYEKESFDFIAGIESRGFIFGAPISYALGKGFIPLRKAGKLPGETVSQEYELEYGTDRIEIHKDALSQGARVLVIDDLVATGGTAEAAVKLIEKLGGVVIEACFIVDLPDLGGADRLSKQGIPTFSLVEFEGE